MPGRIDNMTNKTARYQNTKVVEHLASQYVLGTLSVGVQKRVKALCQHNILLEQRINYWQERFVSIDEQASVLPPSENSWSVIAEALDIDTNMDSIVMKSIQPERKKQGFLSSITTWFSDTLFSTPLFPTPMHRLATAFSVVTLVLVTLVFVNPLATNNQQLSYVAVLTELDGNAHIVATTYGESKKLVVNVINAPDIEKEQALELWVVSKTDAQARSLGIIDQDKSLIEQQLTQAQWRLIKDSESLIVTIEEAGGSPIGEPSELIVSRGLCVRLQEWNKNV